MDNKLSYNKLSDSNLASELVENRNFKPITIEEIVIFMINHVIFMMYIFFFIFSKVGWFMPLSAYFQKPDAAPWLRFKRHKHYSLRRGRMSACCMCEEERHL